MIVVIFVRRPVFFVVCMSTVNAADLTYTVIVIIKMRFFSVLGNYVLTVGKREPVVC